MPLASTTAAAASFIPEAFPAVTVPSLENAGRSRAMPSMVASGRMCSSVTMSTVLFFTVHLNGGDLLVEVVAAVAAAARRWLSTASAS